MTIGQPVGVRHGSVPASCYPVIETDRQHGGAQSLPLVSLGLVAPAIALCTSILSLVSVSIGPAGAAADGCERRGGGMAADVFNRDVAPRLP